MTKRARVRAALLIGTLVGALAVASCGSSSEPAREPSAAGMEARSAAEFVDSIGVNVHLSYNDTAYAQVDSVVASLDELGVRHVRDGLQPERPDQYANLNALAAVGVRSTLILGDPQGRFGTGTLEDQLTTLEAEMVGAVEAVEGPNEYDLSGDPEWAAALRDYQEQLYEGITGNPELDHLPVLGPSLVEPQSHEELGDVSASLDYGNAHPYPGGEAPEGSLDQAFALAKSTSGSEPLMATETGYHNAINTTSGHLPASEAATATYLPRLYLENFARGIPRTFAYELLDEKPNPEGTDPEQHFGLLRNDFSKKPAFEALRNLIELTGGAAEACDATPLALEVEAKPEAVRSLLLDRCDGSHVLALWQPVSVWDVDERVDLSPPERPVTVRLEDAVGEVRVHRPTQGIEPLRTLDAPTEVQLEVPADPLIVALESSE